MTDKEKAISLLQQCLDERPYAAVRVSQIMSCIQEAVELLKEQEPKHGRWERITGMAPPEYHGHRICSICECFAPYDPLHMGREILPKYCPGCGAKMEGENECG